MVQLQTFDVFPGGLKITNVPFRSFVTNDIKISWQDLLETLISGVEDERVWLKQKFWDELRDTLEDSEADDLVDWFFEGFKLFG